MNIDKFLEAAQKHIYQLDDFPEDKVKKQIQMELEDVLSLNDEVVLEQAARLHWDW